MSVEVEAPSEFYRAVKLYDVLNRESKDGWFVGSKTKVYESTSLSMKYYPDLFELLTNMGSIEQTQRGNSHEPTRIRIGDAPTLERYLAVSDTLTLTKRDTLDTLRKKVASLEERIPPIDLSRTLINLESRLSALEQTRESGR